MDYRRHRPTDFTCPTCGAKKDESCRSSHSRRARRPHEERREVSRARNREELPTSARQGAPS